MIFPLVLGALHALEPDHVAVVTGVSLEGERKGAWKIGLAFGFSHMLAVALLAGLGLAAGQTLLGDGLYLWLDRLAWMLMGLLGLWNLAAALGWRKAQCHSHAHLHAGWSHSHPHEHGVSTKTSGSHRFHHSAAWLGAFFGLGGVRGFCALTRNTAVSGLWPFLGALLLFGLGIVGMFTLLSSVSGWVAARLGTRPAFRRGLFAVSGVGNLCVAFWLLARN